MRRPAFGATILVVLLMTLVGGAVRGLRDLIPPAAPNGLAAEPGAYLRQGAFQRIDWKTIGPETFAEARRLDKPILLVVGTPWSRLARAADQGPFNDPDIQVFLKRTFVCVRVDGSIQPDWLNVYLPYSRAAMGFSPDFQMWFLDPTGKMCHAILFDSPQSEPDSAVLLSQLVEARERLRKMASGDLALPAPGGRQAAEVGMIDQAGVEPPDVARHLDELARAMDGRYGGFLSRPGHAEDRGYQRLLPQSLRVLLAGGRLDLFRSALDPALTSPIVDWLDGGFYLRSATVDWMRPEYDKTAIHNAEMMEVLAMAGAITGIPIYRRLAESTFDSLAGPFMEGGLVRACRVGDEVSDGRSTHSSFPPRLLRDALSGVSSSGLDLRRWARETFDLRVEDNPAMLVRLADANLSLMPSPTYTETLDALRQAANSRPPTYAGTGLVDVNGEVAAQMFWVARLWGDSVRRDTASALFEQVRKSLVGDDVSHGPQGGRPGTAYLGDYLAYADAALQGYLATGRSDYFESGLRVLERARALFRGPRPGEWDVVSSSVQGAVNANAPELVDNEGESCSAKVIRLCNAYGRLLRDASPAADLAKTRQATALVQDAAATMGLFAGIASDMGPSVSGYYAASLGLMDDAHAFAVGPDCRSAADLLFQRVPTRLVVGCAGHLRPDLQRRAPGIYVVRRNRIEGPMTVDQAAASLGWRHNLQR